MNTNQVQIRIIIATLSGLAFVCVTCICVLSYLEKAIPPELNTLAGTLSAGLLGMLVKTSPTETTKSPARVEVVNPPSDPVQTEEANPWASGNPTN